MPQTAQPVRSLFKHRLPGLRTIMLMLGGVLLLVLLNVGSLRRYVTARQQRNRIAEVVESKKESLRELERQKRSLELGMFENEKSVRESYRLLRPGERMILLVPEESKTSGTTAAKRATK